MTWLRQLLTLFTPVTPSPSHHANQTATRLTLGGSLREEIMAEYLRRKWLHLRMFRTVASFQFDYRILQNYSHLARMGK